MIDAYDLLNRISQERTRYKKEGTSEFIKGIVSGMDLALAVVRDMIEERKEFARVGRRMKA